ncbi:hypothetical protein [Metamycoplasma alkalescens]|nr:hypothetical protein [Metamycoplasma alkalescens]
MDKWPKGTFVENSKRFTDKKLMMKIIEKNLDDTMKDKNFVELLKRLDKS